MDRREFCKTLTAGLVLPAAAWSAAPPSKLVVVRNAAPAELVRKAVQALGGMSQFVKKGQTVLLKPNIGWDRSPEQAANTNPEAVAEVVKMCFEAGAGRVRVLDRTCNQAQRCYSRSGIEKAAAAAGAQVRHIIEGRFKEVAIPQGALLKSWPFYLDVLEADVFINMPVAKHHSISQYTLGFKNLMGVMGGDRGSIHNKFMTKIVDINSALKPTLTIIDAYRVMLRNGPTGGSLADVAEKKTVIAGVDRVAVDAYGMTLFGVKPEQVEYLRLASERGLGQSDLTRVSIEEING
ncbi:MAG: hypothetical protein BWY83_00264 [bacterium ADurb.Bin478]|nr:MAG: hypothetical protein BWY83_00264 [bacterium ADurb.Bin478]